ncbi:uncharacterized protein OCT59_028155 [Rhizophagus irregularis]|uniref:uncharacterized protein n=1 Tax=Rhizophagus irregularis TaxID=588596 RepID=UPI00331A8F13|nr:hypothetical protein OCT59_028155 [Rhizophagus irregularis]
MKSDKKISETINRSRLDTLNSDSLSSISCNFAMKTILLYGTARIVRKINICEKDLIIRSMEGLRNVCIVNF